MTLNRSSRGPRVPRLFIPLLLAALLGGGCENFDGAMRGVRGGGGEKAAESKAQKKDLVPVEVAGLERGGIEAVLRFSSNLEAESSVQVFSQASRIVRELRVEEGDQVREGQVLLRLQNEEQTSAITRAESQLKKARRELQRQVNLFEKELISEQAMNDATYEVEQLEIALVDAQRELSYTEVRAPIRGTVTSRLVNLGDTVTMNQHLFDLVDFDTLVARVFVPEKDLSRLEVGQAARVWSQSLEEPRRGEVIRISPVVDPRSGTIKVTLGIPRNQGLRPGQYVETELVVETLEQALLIPKRALVFDDTRVFVYRFGELSTVERLEIETAVEDRDHVVATGEILAEGDRVVIAGQAGLKDGMKVRLAESGRGDLAAEAERSEL
ncbi:MAG: efflux RND transporter periplasmic adaptor subunit [Acidobacteriota bacterium]